MFLRPSISVAMCTYNGSAHIEEQLESIMQQEELPMELIICDDRSTDDTSRVVEKYKVIAPFKIHFLINDKKLGVTRNFEKAISICSGEVIALSDQDDVWDRLKLRTLVDGLLSNPKSGYVFSNAKLVDENMNIIGNLWDTVGFSKSRINSFINESQLITMLVGGSFVYGNTLLFRTSLRPLIMPINIDSQFFTHDTWISLLLSAKGCYGVPMDQELIYYRQHPRQQIGAVMNNSLSARASRLMSSKEKYYVDYVNMLRAINERLQSEHHVSKNELNMCIDHLEKRASLYLYGSWMKLECIIEELRMGRYKKYSSGWKSVIKDLLTIW